MSLENIVRTKIGRSEREILTELTAVHFDGLAIDEDIITGIHASGYTYLSKVQNLALPRILGGRENIGLVSTCGTGKTLAYAIIALNHVKSNVENVQVLILCAGYEAALQTWSVLIQLASHTNIKIGLTVKDGNVRLTEPDCHILVGSPREIASFKLMRLFDINCISLCIMDDADIVNTTSLIQEQITRPLKCKKILISSSSLAFASKYVENINNLVHNGDDGISQYFLKCGDVSVKFKAILSIYKCLVETNQQGIIFVQDCDTAIHVERILQIKGMSTIVLHRNVSMDERKEKYMKFRDGQYTFAVATDLIARSVSFESVRIVVNYDIPELTNNRKYNGLLDSKSYRYRLGRACHMGREGILVNLVSPEDMSIFEQIGIAMEEMDGI